MRKYFLSIIFICIICTSCRSKNQDAQSQVLQLIAQQVSFCQLSDNGAKYLGKPVTVTANIVTLKQGVFVQGPASCKQPYILMKIDDASKAKPNIKNLSAQMLKAAVADTLLTATLSGHLAKEPCPLNKANTCNVFVVTDATTIQMKLNPLSLVGE
jgi:hypothetical protein